MQIRKGVCEGTKR